MNELGNLKRENYSHIKDWSDEVIKLAIEMHNTYEVIAKQENWETQKSTHLKPFESLPMENQRVMLRMADFIIKRFAKDNSHEKKGCGKRISKYGSLKCGEINALDELKFCFNCQEDGSGAVKKAKEDTERSSLPLDANTNKEVKKE